MLPRQLLLPVLLLLKASASPPPLAGLRPCLLLAELRPCLLRTALPLVALLRMPLWGAMVLRKIASFA